jgi:hypothetical protein
MAEPFHMGFTGTRHGMSADQSNMVSFLVMTNKPSDLRRVLAHHGDCVGADAEFHRIVRVALRDAADIAIHPGPLGDLSAGCFGDFRHDRASHMKRNAAIVAISHIMIAAPFENEPQPRGGTWATIRMALNALRAGKLRALYVVGREGQLLEHEEWST